MKRLTYRVMQTAIAFCLGVAALLFVAATYAAFGWVENRFVEGATFGMAYTLVYQSAWLRGSLDRWHMRM